MSFDKDIRSLLAKSVIARQRRLVEEFTDQLRGVFGLHPDGVVLPPEKPTPLSPDQHRAARCLRGLLGDMGCGKGWPCQGSSCCQMVMGLLESPVEPAYGSTAPEARQRRPLPKG